MVPLKLIQRGIVHACKQGGLQRFAFVVSDGHRPSLLGTWGKFVAHRRQGHIQIVVVERHRNAKIVGVDTIFLHEGVTPAESASVLFGHLIG